MFVPAKYAMLLRRILFAPFTLLLGIVLHMRHGLYDSGILKRTRPAVPTIAIGNLALGGTGKTPMLELVLRILNGLAPLATLSRGYGRIGTDVHEVMPDDLATRSGDEPVQVKVKFPSVRVFVGADRVMAVHHIQEQVQGVKAVVMDDALQHRSLDAGMNILLTTWQRPYCDDALVPAGRLRDLRGRASMAQAVVVTKCPALPDAASRQQWRKRLQLQEEQHLFFAGIAYEAPRIVRGSEASSSPDADSGGGVVSTTPVLLVTGIADPGPLRDHIKDWFVAVDHVAFPDHHPFRPSDLEAFAARLAKFAPGPKMLITTEKDAVRLLPLLSERPLRDIPVAVIGMRPVILNEPERFADLIHRHVATHQAHR